MSFNTSLSRLNSDTSRFSFVFSCSSSFSRRAWFYLQAAILLAPAVVRLLRDPTLTARYRGRLPVCNRNLDLSQQAHNLLSRMLPSSRHLHLPFVQSLSSKLVQKCPGTPGSQRLPIKAKILLLANEGVRCKVHAGNSCMILEDQETPIEKTCDENLRTANMAPRRSLEQLMVALESGSVSA